MQSAYNDILTALGEATFSIPNVTVRKPYDESDKTFPSVVLHEITNEPLNHGTVNGEIRTVLGYQVDIATTDCVNTKNAVLGRYEANMTLRNEVVELLNTEFKLTRRFTGDPQAISTEVVESQTRFGGVLDSHGYTYRP